MTRVRDDAMILAALFLDVFAGSHAKTLCVALKVSEQELLEGLARGHEFRRLRILHCRPPAYPYAALRWAVSRSTGFRASRRKEQFRDPLGCDRARFSENMPIDFERERDARVTSCSETSRTGTPSRRARTAKVRRRS